MLLKHPSMELGDELGDKRGLSRMMRVVRDRTTIVGRLSRQETDGLNENVGTRSLVQGDALFYAAC